MDYKFVKALRNTGIFYEAALTSMKLEKDEIYKLPMAEADTLINLGNAVESIPGKFSNYHVLHHSDPRTGTGNFYWHKQAA